MYTRPRARAALALASAAAMVAGPAVAAGAQAAPDPSTVSATLDLAFWGNEDRAALYASALEAFNEEYPEITVNSTFLAFPEFWEKRQIEAAGGDLPDVMQFDYSYLRQYSENGLLLDLGPFLGNEIATDGFSEQALGIGVVDGTTTAVPIGTNAWGLFLNLDLLAEVGVDPYPGGTSWDDYQAWMGEVTEAGGGEVWGGTDWTGRIQNFEIQMRANGTDLFSDEGEPQFTEDDLAAYWTAGDPLRDGITVPTERLLELTPISGFGAAITTSELTWDNFGAGYLADLGVEADSIELIAPPTAVEGAADLYLKPSMLHAIAANTDNPEASAILVDFLVNSEAAGEIFGTNRGIPASSTQFAGVELDPLSQRIADYESSIADRLGAPPPVPVVGYGAIEETFRVLGEELGLGTVSVDDAVSQFMTEVDVILSQ